MQAPSPGQPAADPSDEDLVRRVREGEESAARLLFDRHAERLRARVKGRLPGLLRRRVSASDVVQQAYLAAFRNLGGFEDRGDGSFSAWLGRILENKVNEEIRRHFATGKRRAGREASAAGSPSEVLHPPAHDPTASTVAMRGEAREQVERVVAALPENYREVIRLVHGQGLLLREVARLTGRTEAAVRKLYGRALEAFTRRMNSARPGER